MAIGGPTVTHLEFFLPVVVGLICVASCIASAIAVWRKGEYPAAFKNARHNPTSRNLFWACMIFGILLGSVIALLSLDVALYAR
jgi:hypothetical protein